MESLNIWFSLGIGYACVGAVIAHHWDRRRSLDTLIACAALWPLLAVVAALLWIKKRLGGMD